MLDALGSIHSQRWSQKRKEAETRLLERQQPSVPLLYSELFRLPPVLPSVRSGPKDGTPGSNLSSCPFHSSRDINYSSNTLLFGPVQSPLASPSRPTTLVPPPAPGRRETFRTPTTCGSGLLPQHPLTVPGDLAPSKLPQLSPGHSPIPENPRLPSSPPPARAVRHSGRDTYLPAQSASTTRSPKPRTTPAPSTS